MFAIARFQVQPEDQPQFLEDLKSALAALAACDGYLSGRYGINTDDPELLAMITQWRNFGSYRRALSNYQVKMVAVPILARAIDEPGGFIASDE